MNKLWVRFALAFVAVTLVGVSVVAVLADFAVRGNVGQFVSNENTFASLPLVSALAAHYEQNGNWSNVAQVFGPRGGPGFGPGPNAGMMGGQQMPPGMMQNRPPRLVADANYRIVYGDSSARIGTALSAEERTNALAIQVGNQTVGYFATATSDQSGLTPEQQLLDQLRGTLVIAALLASGLGVVLSLVIGRTLAAPLANLARAARALAKGEKKQRVSVRGAEEIAGVARAFNEMADELERAETVRRNMVADIAHELRTPLTVMQGNLSAMLDEVYPLDRQEIATLYDQTRLLSRLVNDLRELALADAGQLQLNLAAVNVNETVRAVVANFETAADAQNISIRFDPEANLPPARADADRLSQVLVNLLANAIRHTPGGGGIRLRAYAKENARVEIDVSDTGEGIAPEDLPHVFERFYRGDKARTRATGSTGLGLAIAKAWVEAMDGTIGVESEFGHGTRFWFALPVAA